MKKRGRGINNNSKRRSSGHKSKNPQRKTERKSSGIARDKNYYMKWVGIQIVLYAIILFLFHIYNYKINHSILIFLFILQ